MTTPAKPNPGLFPKRTTHISGASSSSKVTVPTVTYGIIHSRSPSSSLPRSTSHSPASSSRYRSLAAFSHLSRALKPHHRRTNSSKLAMRQEQEKESINRMCLHGNYMRAVEGQQDGSLPEHGRSDGDDESKETVKGQGIETEPQRGRARDRQHKMEKSDVEKDHWSHENFKHEMHLKLCTKQ